MAIDPMWIWIAVAALVVIAIVAVFARGARRSRSEALRDKFGPEYDHAVHTRGSRTRAEQELLARAEEAKEWSIRPLTASEGNRYRGEWARIEQHFIQRPTTAVVEADELIADMMQTQGYPMGDFERHSTSLSVTHPRVVEHYRAGHSVIRTDREKAASTEELRQAMLHYRQLFNELVGDSGDVVRDVPRNIDTVSEIDDIRASRSSDRLGDRIRVDTDRDQTR